MRTRRAAEVKEIMNLLNTNPWDNYGDNYTNEQWDSICDRGEARKQAREDEQEARTVAYLEMNDLI